MQNRNFDYIIIGGGSAGCVLANRLSENPNVQVCLLEAGPRDSNPMIKMPMGLMFGIRSKSLDWHDYTEPQSHCADRKMFWPHGRTLGGGSSINAMVYVRGNPHDYDNWAELGCEGWAYHDVFPYFMKMENFEPGKNEFHGVGGPMNVATPRYLNPLMHAFIAAGEQAGFQHVEDYNAASQEGVCYTYVAQKDGQRLSNARGYLHPVEKRENLTVLTGAHAAKILFDGKRAVGVRYQKGGKLHDIRADKEVILSAGAICSPQLLMLSGVGPRAELEKHNIPVVQDVPGVGENLHDHLDIHVSCRDKTHTSVSFQPTYFGRLVRGVGNYAFKKTGELTSNYTAAVGFMKSKPDLTAPDLQWHFIPSMYTYSALKLKPMLHYGFSLMVCHLHPESRGRITLRDASPFSKPVIDANYLSSESDLDALVTGVKKSREIFSRPAFEPYVQEESQPGKSVVTDEQIRQYIRENAETLYHPVGTCKMGVDPMSVVDPQTLKVHGLENLRVIDASIMPTITSGNTNAPVTMIAEKGADMILRDHELKLQSNQIKLR